MIIKANVMMGLTSLYASKQRSILALLGIVIGIGSVIAMVSIGTIAKEESLRQFLESGTDYVVISKGWGGRSGADAPKITEENADELAKRLTSLKLATPLGQGGGQMIYRGQTISASILAVKNAFMSANRFKLSDGRFVSDLDKNMPYCVIGVDVAKDFEKKGAAKVIGSEFRLNDRLYTVVGILEKAPSGGMRPFNVNKAIMIPISTFMRNFENAEIENIIARMKDEVTTKQVVQDVKSYFKLRTPELSIEVNTAEELIEQMNKQAQMFTILLGGVGAIALVVGGIGVMNVMLVSVAERRKEIGIRRALGALQRDIQMQFIIESLVLCFVGGIIGVIIGVGSSYVFANINEYTFIISNNAILLGVVVSTGVGLFFGYYPARQASKLDPIVALRS